jgi:tetratricopeptide (TPR) repeat protein
MRFVDITLAAVLLLAGCASDVKLPVATEPVPAAAAAPVVHAEPEVMVSASAQRTFDDAVRALRAGRTEEAERAFRALVKEQPQLGGPHANLGLIYRQAGKLPEAAAALEQAVRASPQQALYFNQLGVTYRHQGQFAKAREAYEKAIALDPTYAAPLLNLGILHDLYLGNGPRALELYGHYLALSPGGDAVVTKWVADLKNRKQQVGLLTRKEKE